MTHTELALQNETARIEMLKQKIAKSEVYIQRLKRDCELKVDRAEKGHERLLDSLKSGMEYLESLKKELSNETSC